MSGFSPCVPFTPFAGVGGRHQITNFSEDTSTATGPPQDQGPGAGPEPVAASDTGPSSGFTAGAFRGFRNTYDNNPIGCLQERMQNDEDDNEWGEGHDDEEEEVHEEWVDPDEWNDYDNLSDDEEEHEEDQDQEKEEISQAIDNYINKDREDSDKLISKKSSESDEKEQTKEENTNFRSERHSFDHDIDSNPEEVGFGVFRTDEFGKLQQIGFGQPREDKFAHFHSQNLEEDFPSRGWGQGFISAPHHPPVNDGFGSFLDQKPSPFAPPGFVPFGRGGGGRGFPRAGRPLPPQESLFKSNLKKGSSEVTLPNGLQAMGSGATKKLSKHNAARAMLDILDGRAAAVTEQVSQSITDGLKALRGDGDSRDKDRDRGSGRDRDRDRGKDRDRDERHGAKTFKPQYVYKQSEQDFLDNQKKHQEEILKQSIEYGPLGVKLWFTGDSKNKEVTCTEPNRPPPDTNMYCPPSDDDRLECVAKGQFFIKGPVHNETMEDYIEKIVFEAAWLEILKRSGQQESENVCKLCNLVFISKKCYDEHKYTDDHLHVCKGYFPGKGGYHCFLCWISFNQPEGLLNHVARSNHQKRATKKGVARIWMEPVSSNSWDLINVHKHLEDCRREDESKDWKTRDEARKAKEKEKDRKRKRSRSPAKWSHDKYEEPGSSSSKRKLASDYYKWKEVKDEKRRHSHEDRRRDREEDRYRDDGRSSREASSHYREDSRYSSRDDHRGSSHHRDDYRGSSHYREDDHHLRDERDRGYRDSNRETKSSRSHTSEPSSGGDLRDILKRRNAARSHQDEEPRREGSFGEYEEGEIRSSDGSKHKKKSKDKDRDKKKKRLKKEKDKEAISDHEEVNEIQDDFEIDSVGQIENGEETLQKMKSAIIGILDEEIFALNKKNKK